MPATAATTAPLLRVLSSALEMPDIAKLVVVALEVVALRAVKFWSVVEPVANMLSAVSVPVAVMLVAVKLPAKNPLPTTESAANGLVVPMPTLPPIKVATVAFVCVLEAM